MVAQDMQEAEQLMTEVGMLVENALPPSYQEISGELSLGLDEEFIELIVPSVDVKPLTYESRKRGALSC
jgi:hypothetical protein